MATPALDPDVIGTALRAAISARQTKQAEAEAEAAADRALRADNYRRVRETLDALAASTPNATVANVNGALRFGVGRSQWDFYITGTYDRPNIAHTYYGSQTAYFTDEAAIVAHLVPLIARVLVPDA